jgi:WD40 repeat protein
MRSLMLLVGLLYTTAVAATEPASALDKLDARAIPETARFAGQPPELVAVLGEPLAASKEGHYRFRLAIRPDGRMIAANLAKHKVRLWDLQGPEPKAFTLSIEPSGHDCSIRFAPDGKLLAVSGGNDLHLWDVSGTEPRKKTTIKAQKGGFQALALEFSVDGRALIIGGRGGTVYRLDPTKTEPKELLHLSFPKKTYVWALALAPDGKTLACSSFSNNVAFVDLGGPEPKELPALPRGGWAQALSFSPDGKRLALGTEGGVAPLVWRMAEARFEATALEKSTARTLNGVAFSPDGKYLAGSCFDKGQVIVWDAASGKKLYDWTFPGANDLAFAADGKHLMTANTTNTVYVLRVAADRRAERSNE